MIKTLYILALSLVLNATDLSTYINKQNCSQIIDKQVFTICISYKMKGARYVGYTLDGNKVNAVNIKKRNSFYTEKNIPKRYRSAPKDYGKSGYDKGHLANHSSFDYSEKATRKTYSIANVIPQSPKVNRYTWFKAEKFERKIAVSLGTVNVLNGVVYSSKPQRIGKNKIAVPDGFWKMIYNDSKGYKKCFYYNNNLNIVAKGDKLKSHLIACDTLK